MMQIPIYEKIAQLRKAAGLTQEQLGERLGISGQAVSKWEKGESLPDILLLPELCGILGISVDMLLEVPGSLRQASIIREFCAFARDNGRSATILEAVSRLFDDAGNKAEAGSVDFGPDFVRIYDACGMGFVVSGADYVEKCFNGSTDHISYILRPLAEAKILEVLRLTSVDRATTREEIVEATGFDEDTINRYLLALMKRKFIEVDTDACGKLGYVQSTAIAGVFMILAGCRVLEADGAVNGWTRFTRIHKESSQNH